MVALAVNPSTHQLGVEKGEADNAGMHKKRRATPLARLMEKFMDGKGISDNELARAVGIPQSTVTRIATGETKSPEDETLRPLAEFFGVTTDHLRGKAEIAPAELPEGKYVHVARYQAIGGLGRGRYNAEHVEISGSHAYKADTIRKRGWRPEALAVIQAEGPSMSPTINDGDLVLINMDETKIISGLIYAIEDAENGTRIKRLHKLLDGRVKVSSDNEDKRLFPDDYLTPDTGARIIGRAVDRSGPL